MVKIAPILYVPVLRGGLEFFDDLAGLVHPLVRNGFVVVLEGDAEDDRQCGCRLETILAPAVRGVDGGSLACEKGNAMIPDRT